MHKTSAWPLSLVYAALIVYASLFPFEGWRAQGIAPWVFLTAPLPPPYWTGFDVASNIAGYLPLGFLLSMALAHGGKVRWPVALALAFGMGTALSLCMEFLQIYLPQRVPSNLDLLLNMLGCLLGALAAALLARQGLTDYWTRFRARWFAPDARSVLVLLALWPWALLFPAAEPFGLGQVLERLERALAQWLGDTPFLAWLPVREGPLQALSPAAEALCVALGLLVPCLLALSISRTVRKRAALVASIAVIGVGATALSSALSWGPAHAWAWLTVPVQAGIVLALLLAAAALGLRQRLCAVLALVVVILHSALLNAAPTSAYFAQTLLAWEQGRFIRFYGIGQWLGWLWPFGALLILLQRASRKTPPHGEVDMATQARAQRAP